MEAAGKIADEGFHFGVPETVESKETHFVEGLVDRPFFDGHTIGGDEDAGAVFAIVAVDEDFFVRTSGEEREELHDLVVRGRGESSDRDAYEVYAQLFGFGFFAFADSGGLAAEIDDGSDAEFLKLLECGNMRLSPTKKRFIDFAGVGNARDADFFAVGGVHLRSGGDARRSLREHERGQRGKKERESETQLAGHYHS